MGVWGLFSCVDRRVGFVRMVTQIKNTSTLFCSIFLVHLSPRFPNFAWKGRKCFIQQRTQHILFTVIWRRKYGKDHSDSERGNLLPPYGLLFPISSKGFLYASSHRQDNTYHSLCYTSRGALAGTRFSSMGPPMINPHQYN